ncbi:contact-dependent growth inhibition system immunity protein [Xenorhabdus sp. SF857]|nr:contact-dependent growth inhibition system immunity protein [Xenorhabdus sp. SF857]WFQ80877.1 contact-dependent growth inhibition system immunity protein [Xenorhabdus sp. SF857]
MIEKKTLHLAVPEKTTTAQWAEINKSISYAAEKKHRCQSDCCKRRHAMIDDIGSGLNASIDFNGDFYYVKTLSGYRLLVADHEAGTIYFPKDASDKELGCSVRKALSQSRLVDPEDNDFFHRDMISIRYKNWIAEAMKKGGYKTKRALFKKMNKCDVNLLEGKITISPQAHQKLDTWGKKGMPDDCNITLSVDVTDEELGKAIREAFTRCKSFVYLP